MSRVPRHLWSRACAACLLPALAALLALPGLAADVGFASTDATDPYLWLEDIDGARALDWVRAQNAATEKKLASQPLYQELRSEARRHLRGGRQNHAVARRGERKDRGIGRKREVLRHGCPEAFSRALPGELVRGHERQRKAGMMCDEASRHRAGIARCAHDPDARPVHSARSTRNGPAAKALPHASAPSFGASAIAREPE